MSQTATVRSKPPADVVGPQQAALRLLATTDLHMQLLGHDYVADTPLGHHGLAGLARLIEKARHEARDQGSMSVLVDNGDMLQGNALGEWLADRAVGPDHPVAATLNHLGYDAIGLGNHDLDYGLTYLQAVARQLRMPLVCSNLHRAYLHPLRDAALIDCALPVPAGQPAQKLRIGILSVLPEQTAIWNHHVLANKAEIDPAVPCLNRAVAALRAQGADLVVVLAHMGIGNRQSGAESMDSALSLTQVPGIDALITGHTHRRFPGVDHPMRAGVNSDVGLLGNRPAIMPGYGGSDLAVMDLTLQRSAKGPWHIAAHSCDLRVNTADILPDRSVEALCLPAHVATRHHLSAPIGHTGAVLHNYFSMARPTSTCALIARAKARVLRAALAGTAQAHLPLLASTAAHTAGGHGGPAHYINIPKGKVLRRHLAGLSPYINQIWAIRITGAQLYRWLEHAAGVYQTQNHRYTAQNLLDPEVPGFNFDTIFGLTYRIDPTCPRGARISGVAYQGKDVQAEDLFVLCTNQFRAQGGGGFDPVAKADILIRSTVRLEDALTEALAHPEEETWEDPQPWRFDCRTQVRTELETTPAALAHLEEIADLHPVSLGRTSRGFARIGLTL